MNLKTKVATFAAASIFALSLGSSALAATPATVIQKIVPNTESAETLNASLASGEMSSFTFSNDAGQSNGSLTLGVKDARGSNAGWDVTLQVGSFKRGADGQNVTGLVVTDITSSGFAITGAGTLESNPGPLVGITRASPTTGFSNAKTVLTAIPGAGTGVYTQPYDVSLAIPAQQAPGTYTADVTVSISSAPGN